MSSLKGFITPCWNDSSCDHGVVETGWSHHIGRSYIGHISNLYYEVANGDQEILLLYVDDLFGTGEGKLILDSKRELVTEYEMEDLGIMHDFSDLEVWQKRSKIMVSQGKYAVEIFDEIWDNGLGIHDYTEDDGFIIGDTTSERVDATLYRKMIGSRLDICFTENTLS